MAQFDDGIPLAQYDFQRDNLALDPLGSESRLRKLSYRYRKIRHIYERQERVAFLTQGTIDAKTCTDLRQSINEFGDGWGLAAQRALEAAASRGYINLLVTSTQLVPAFCKCLIYHLDPWFSLDSIYSSSHIRKKHCFEAIQEQYGKGHLYVGIGDGPEEQEASRDCEMPFVKVTLTY